MRSARVAAFQVADCTSTKTGSICQLLLRQASRPAAHAQVSPELIVTLVHSPLPHIGGSPRKSRPERPAGELDSPGLRYLFLPPCDLMSNLPINPEQLPALSTVTGKSGWAVLFSP